MAHRGAFTDRELDIMSVLWKLGSGTVAEVRDALGDALGYTSVLKMLQILEEKGAVRHEAEGRAYRYFAVVEPDEAGRWALKRVVNKIFQGSTELVLARLVSDRKLSAPEIQRMRSLLDEAAVEAGSRDDPPEPPDPDDPTGSHPPQASDGEAES
ncbi:MAG TPA: BlaI/MecI/CopY family transcriptional regulator [Longimicrobiales bacterium]|jgi:predicted transcriptional regulator